ncbi:transmembrane protein, putative (macronuclear) [Tetrahymena thermophila SB210]|uniref:Transmembrane protein, putative n=1 Tax=Tetrahymena thermophila (strain SB210) TaxID=312017 RepID=Q22UG1_TETTS|nr:transmembrane protein, putative [Tetrahymena thermophila SB210]EAR89009.2 transmembrane protein, putative [Tetrahymena thermophila SB210]|eukprot:XP_001009254.2 transmembrane protein, putative [Tetrahymena thermophila SB210]
MYYADDTNQYVMKWDVFPILAFIFSWFTNAAQLSYEEMLYRKYMLNPAQVSGYEGMFGIIFALIGSLVWTYIHNQYFQEDFYSFVSQVFSFKNPAIFFLVLVVVLINIFSSCVNQIIIKQMSALTRAISDSNSFILGLLLFMMAGYYSFIWQYLLGYVISILGTIIFCEILVLPWFGFNKNRGHDFVAPKLNLYYFQQTYPQQYQANIPIQFQYNYNGYNNQVVNLENNQQNQFLNQPLLAEINISPNQYSQRPSNVLNNNNNYNQSKQDNITGPQNYQFRPSNISSQDNQSQNRQYTLHQNLIAQPNNFSQNQLNFQTTKEVLKEILSMQFENLTQIKQIIALIQDIQAKTPLQDHSTKNEIAKILKKIASQLTNDYLNTIKMRMLKLVQEDQYANVYKINEMRYISERLSFLVDNNNSNITIKSINEIIAWIEDNHQPTEFTQTLQNIQAINQLFLSEYQRNQEIRSNWIDQYEAIQQKLKSNNSQEQQFEQSNTTNQNTLNQNEQQKLNQNLINQAYQLNQNKQYLNITKEVLKEILSTEFENLTQVKQIIVLIDDINSKINQNDHSHKSKIGKISNKIASVLIKNYSNIIKIKIVKLILDDQFMNISRINEMRYIQDRLYFLVINNNIDTKCLSEIIIWIENNLQPNELTQVTENLQQINEQFLNEQKRDFQQSVSNWNEQYQVILQKLNSS